MDKKDDTQFLVIKPNGITPCGGGVKKPFFILVLVNGILTVPGDNWTERVRNIIKRRFPDAVTVQQEYFGLPLPWWQTFIANRKPARELAGKLRLVREIYGPDVPLFIWTHSNGGPVAIRALKLFPGAACKCLIMLASACHASVRRNGIRWLYEQKALDRAVAWHNKKDEAIAVAARVAGFLSFGLTWGRCGETGFKDQRRKEPFWNWRDPLPEHSDNLQPRYIEQTIDELLRQSMIGMTI